MNERQQKWIDQARNAQPSQRDDLEGIIVLQDDEIKRLRAALQQIADGNIDTADKTGWGFMVIAREALNVVTE